MKTHWAVGRGLLLCALLWGSHGLGQTWTLTGAPLTNWSAIACSADGRRLAAASTGGIFLSPDSGSTWTQSSAPAGEWTAIASSAEGNTLVAVGPNGTWISTNSGATWVGPQWTGFSSIACSSSGIQMIGGVPPGMHGGGLVMISQDSGQTWAASGGYTGPNYCVAVASSAAGNSLVVAGNDWVYGRPLWTSSDSGLSWTMHDSNFWQDVACSADGTRIFAKAAGPMQVSGDSGMSWQTVMISGAPWCSGIACSADGARGIFADGSADPGRGIYVSSDAGLTWTSNAVPTVSWTAVACSADGGRMFAAAGGAGIYTLQTNPALVLSITNAASALLLSWIWNAFAGRHLVGQS